MAAPAPVIVHSPVPPTPFNPARERWEAYVRRFNIFLGANGLAGVPDDQKRDLFLTHCGLDVFDVAEAVAAPDAPEAKSWTDLLAVLAAHYDADDSATVRRFEFRDRMQQKGESVSHFVTALKKHAKLCAFPDVDLAIRDQFIYGIQDKDLQKRLLRKKHQTLAAVVTEAKASESSGNAAATLKRLQAPVAVPDSQVHYEALEELSLDGSEGEEDEDDSLSCNQAAVQTKPPRSNPPEPQTAPTTSKRCSCCGDKRHEKTKCRFKEATCRRCLKKGHLATVCRAPAPHTDAGTRPVSNQQSGKGLAHKVVHCVIDSFPEPDQGQTPVRRGKKVTVPVYLDGRKCMMELDSGAHITLISWATLRSLLPMVKKKDLKKAAVTLSDCQGRAIPVLGVKEVLVEFEGERSFKGHLPIVVSPAPVPTLLGTDWFPHLGLYMGGYLKVGAVEVAERHPLLDEFKDVFAPGLGRYVGSPISLPLDPAVPPVRLKARRVPLALRDKVDTALDELIEQGVLSATDYSPWETPIVTPVKPDGSVRICADYKCSINRGLQQSAYPVPVISHLLHSMAAGSFFAKLDMAQAYQQLVVDEAAAVAQTIVTHRGAFKCHRLQFGVNVAPGIFQSVMERLLSGLPGVIPYFDDVLVAAESPAVLTDRVRAVLEKFRAAGLRLKESKCTIGAREVEFLGFRISGKGIQPTRSKVQAIKEAPEPQTKQELQAFLGLLNFYNTFLAAKASVAEPLHRLLRKGVQWVWGKAESKAFQAVKNLLSADSFLFKYSLSLPLRLSCDASPVGVGGVLSHVLPSGKEAPIAFFSRTLSPAERNYAHIDREALAIVAAVKKFHDFVYGRKFEIFTDHKPLLGILAGDRRTPQAIPPRFLRWSLFLRGYDYTLVHCPGKKMGHADGLSRCPLPELVRDPAPKLPVLSIHLLNSGPVNAERIAKASAKDPILRPIFNWVLRGWPMGKVETKFAAFGTKKSELSTAKGVLLWGDRVIIPSSLQADILEILHSGHPGVVRMKALGRSHVWWPGMDGDIEAKVAACETCQSVGNHQPKIQPAKWEKPMGPWSRIHVDFAGPIKGTMLLIVVDAFSRWLEVIKMGSTTTEAVIPVLSSLFATHGLPDILVSDNGPQFTSLPFEQYLGTLGIRHVLTSPYHPQSNGLAERYVHVTKLALEKLSGGSWGSRINEFLAWQHATPLAATGVSPAELLMGRKLRTVLDRCHPQFCPEVDPILNGSPRKVLRPDETVYARSYREGEAWLPATVLRETGPRSYEVQLRDGRVWKRHPDQLKSNVHFPQPTNSQNTPFSPPAPAAALSPTQPAVLCEENTRILEPESGEGSVQKPQEDRREALAPEAASDPDPPTQEPEVPAVSTPLLRRSNRPRVSPSYLKDYVLNYLYPGGEGCNILLGEAIETRKTSGAKPLSYRGPDPKRK